MSGRGSEPCFRRSVRKTLAINKQRDWGQVRVAKISLRNWTQNLPRFFHSSSTVAVFTTAPRFNNWRLWAGHNAPSWHEKKKKHNNNKKPQIKPRLKDWSFRKNERLPPYPSPPPPPSIYHSIINCLLFLGIAESLPQKNIRRQSRASFGGCILYSQVLIMRFWRLTIQCRCQILGRFK